MFGFRGKNSSYLIALAVFILLIFLHITRILSPVESLVVRIFAPLEKSSFILNTKINGWYDMYKERKEAKAIIEENQRLREEIKGLLLERSKITSLEEENRELRLQMDFLNKSELKDKSLTGNIIGHSGDQDINSLVIDRGSKDGVKEDMAVLTGEGILFGKIIKADRDTSLVILLTDNHSKVAAGVQNDTKTSGLVEGQLGLGMQMNLIPKNEDISEGDIVVTSGLEEKIPKGLVIGQIEKIIPGQANDLFKSAILRAPIDYNTVSIVNIIKDK